jgi:PAS domain S-box-containing protein
MIGRTAEMTGVRADGSEFPIEITLEVILVGGQKGFTTYIRDLTEKKAAEALYAAGIGVAGVLAEAVRFEDVAYSALRTVCQALDWELGGIWILDEAAQVLRLTDFWHASDVDAAPLEQESRRRVFSRGLGLPGLTWERGGPVWIPEVFAEHGCPRYELATRCGFKSAAAFPIRAGGEILGVAEFFAREMAEPDQGMQDLFSALGSRIGQFLRRSREEERHHETVLMLESVLHHSPLGIALLDPELTVKFWNPAMETIFGWTAKEMVGMPYTLVVPKEQREQFRRNFQTTLAGKEFVGSDSWRMRKDGSPVHGSISGGPVFDAHGRVAGMVGIILDLTKPKPVV